MQATTPLIVILSVAWILVLPNISSSILVITDNIIVRGGLIFAIILALTLGPMEGGIVFFAVCLTFMERNRRKIAAANRINTNLGNDGINQTPSLVENILSNLGLGARYEQNDSLTATFVPKDDLGTNVFTASSFQGSAVLEQKHVLESQPLGSSAGRIYDNNL